MSIITYRSSTDMAEARAIFPEIASIENCYPDFRNWYFGKAVPDLGNGKGRMVVAEQDGRVVGIVLGKRDGAERKLRCVRVDPRARHNGIGTHLFEWMMRELETDAPLVTVSEEMLHGLSRMMVNVFGYRLTSVDRGTYRPGKLEYVFNGNAS